MKILFGTTNPSKLNGFRKTLEELDVEILSLKDLNIDLDVEEDGNSPIENSKKKALEYMKLSNMPTFAIDYGLYIDKFEEKKQPGVNVRRIVSKKATDKDMLNYYVEEIEKVGGRSKGKWVMGLSLALPDGSIKNYKKDYERLFLSKPSSIMIEGAPLASLQFDEKFNKYRSEMTNEELKIDDSRFDKDMIDFFKTNLNLD